MGELSPHLAQCGLGRGLLPYQVASSSIQLFGHNRHRPIWGELGPHLTQNRLAEAYLHTKWPPSPSSRLATTDIGQNWGGAVPR